MRMLRRVSCRRLLPRVEELEPRVTPSIGPDFQPHLFLTGQILEPSPGQDSNTTVTIDPSGRVGVFWQDSPSPAVAPVIHGTMNLTGVFTVSKAGTILAAAAALSGDVAIAWQSATTINGITDGCYVSFYSNAGVALGGPVYLANTGSTGGGAPGAAHVSLAGDDSGRFLVAWQPQMNAQAGVEAQIFFSTGNGAALAPFWITAAEGLIAGPDVVVEKDVTFVVLWWSSDPAWDTAAPGGLVGERFGSGGNAEGSFFTVNLPAVPPAAQKLLTLSVAADGNGNLVAVWPDYTITPPDTTPRLFAMHVQRFTDQGVLEGLVGDVDGPIENSAGADVVPHVAMDGAGYVEVVYASNNPNVQGNSVYAKRIDPNGDPLATIARINTSGDIGGPSDGSASPIGVPTVAANANGDFVFGWTAGGNFQAVVYTGATTDYPPYAIGPIAASDKIAYARTLYYESMSYLKQAYDEPLRYTAQLGDGSPLPAWLHIDNDGRLYGMPDPADVGMTYDVFVTATDNNGWSGSVMVPITVKPDPTLPNGSAFTVDPSGEFQAGSAAAAINTAGESMVVWLASGYPGAQVMGRIYNAQHQPITPTFQISDGYANEGFRALDPPSVTVDPNGNFVVAWDGQLQGGGTNDAIYIERLNHASVAGFVGLPIGQPVEVVPPLSAPHLLASQVSIDSTGNLLVTWASEQAPGTSTALRPSVYMQRFDLQGNALGPPVLVTANATANADGADYAAAASPSGNILEAWEANGQIVTQLYSAQLQLLGTPVVAGPCVMNANLTMTADGLGNFDLAWVTAGINTFGNVVDVERFSNLGKPLPNAQGQTAPTLVTPDVRADQSNPHIAADANGNFTVVAFSAQGDNTNNWGVVLGQRYDAAGNPVSNPFRVDTPLPGYATGSPTMASDAAGDVLTLWSNLGISGQWYWPTPTVSFPPAQATTAGSPLVFSSANNNAIVIAGGDPTQVETVTLQATVTAGGATTLTLSQLSNLTITGNGTTTITISGTIPSLNAALEGLTLHTTGVGTCLVQMTLTPNGTMSMTGGVAITVHPSVPLPRVVTPLVAADETAFANVLYYESQSYFYDPVGNALTYTATLANGSPLPAWLSLDSSGRLFGVPGPGVAGTAYQVRLTATDPYGNTAVLTLPITVTPDPTEPNGSAFTVAPVAVSGSPAASNAWTGQPAVAVNAAGAAMIVCGMSVSYGEVIMGQIYNAQHQAIGPVFQVNSTVGGTGSNPIITADAAGEFDVNWQAGSVSYLQRFSPLGVAVGPAITLAAEQGLEMVADAAGDLILLWSSQSSIYMRRFDTQSNKLSPTVEVAANGSGYRAAASPSGNVMVVWETNELATMRLFSALLNPLTSAVPFGDIRVRALTVAADCLGNFDVAFLGGDTIEFERFNNLGQPLANAVGETAPTVVASAPTTLQNGAPQVVADRSGDFTIVWSGTISANADDFGQRYDPTGRPVGGAFLIPIGGGTPSIAGDPAGDLLATDLQTKNLGGQWYWPTATVQVPAAQSTNLNSTLAFSTANHNAITLTGGDPTKVETLTLTTGSAATLTVTHTAGLASITGNGTAAVRLTGTSTVLNAALQGLTFHPVSALAPTLQVTLAPNAAMSVSGTVPITVHATVPPANVPPKVTMPAGPLTVAAGSLLVFSAAHGDAITLMDPDAGSTLETLTLSVATGTLKLAGTSGVATVQGNGTGVVRVTGTLSALNAVLNTLGYTAALGAKGSALFNVYVVDSANAMGWASTTLTITP